MDNLLAADSNSSAFQNRNNCATNCHGISDHDHYIGADSDTVCDESCRSIRLTFAHLYARYTGTGCPDQYTQAPRQP